MASTASSDEGEIRDTESEKATTSLSQLDGTSVDRPDRIRSRHLKSRSPDAYGSRRNQYRERSRSPYSEYPSRGSKRLRDDDGYDRRRRDPRRFKVHYEDHGSDHGRRSHKSYNDYDRGAAPPSDLLYDDNDRYREKRRRTRSRSPYRAPRGGPEARSRGSTDLEGDIRNDTSRVDRAASSGFDDQGDRQSREPSAGTRAKNLVTDAAFRPETKIRESSTNQHNNNHTSDVSRNGSGQRSEDASEDAIEPERLDEAALIEQRRKRREAIKAKYRGPATPMLVQALHLADKSAPASPSQSQQGDEEMQSTRSASPITSAPGTPKEAQDEDSPGTFIITDDRDLANTNNITIPDTEDGPSAADYDPTLDMREDRRRYGRGNVEDVSSTAFDETKMKLEQDILLPDSSKPSLNEVKPPKDDFDMFAEDDDDDMFAEELVAKVQVPANLEAPSKAVPIPEGKELDVGMLDNWDDAEGYYKIILGELLNGRYHVQANLGRGMFSAVVRATDVTNKRLVAVKIIRNNETMRKAGFKEIEILQKLNEADPDDKKHLIRLERHFEHKGHLCMVFENLSINLREVLKKFGRDVGINLRAVRAYAQQMFLGLSLMRKCNILHADLKPDNMLVNESRSMLKICDLGSASDSSENEITPYLVSRFYRAPEIILGIPYDFAIDIWSVGCTLYELYTGKILFTGRSNNQMLRSIMECRGKFPTKMLRRAQFAHIHFDDMANLKSVEQDKLTGRDTVKILSFTKPTRDLRARLIGSSKGFTDSEMKELNLFVDLLDRCLALNPEKRCTPMEALKHPFINRAGR